MDGIYSAIMNKLGALGPSGRYFVVSEDDLLEEFPLGAEKSGEKLADALKKLADDGYIDVKYSGGNMYCAAIKKPYEPELPPAEPESQPDVENEQFEASLNEIYIDKKQYMYTFCAALAGGALGSAIIGIIGLFI